MNLTKVDYPSLNARQKENFNLQKLSAVLAEYGFVTHRLSDDWEGADLIARHIHGEVLFIQLKSRLSVYEKYRGKQLYIAFPHGNDWYLSLMTSSSPKSLSTQPSAQPIRGRRTADIRGLGSRHKC